jgi:hypothetical protein
MSSGYFRDTRVNLHTMDVEEEKGERSDWIAIAADLA